MKLLPSILLLALTSLAMGAAPEPRPLLPAGKERPYRAEVLLLGSGLSPTVAGKVQALMEDTATLYRPEQDAGSPEQLLALLESPEATNLLSRRWHAIFVNFPAGDAAEAKTVAEIRKKLEGGGAEVIWTGPQPEGQEDATAAALRTALLKKSAPWAGLPPGERRDPRQLLSDDALLSDPDALELLPSQTATVFRAEQGAWQFNLHSFIAHHNGRFWAIWSSGRVDEDSSSQFIRYATSEDGLKWSPSGVVAGDPDGEAGPLRWLASGLYVEDGKLYALGCLNEGGKQGKVWAGAKLVRLQWTPEGWKNLGVFADRCMAYFPPMKVAGRDFLVWRDEWAHFFTARSGPAQGAWEVKKHPNYPPDYRMSETAAYADVEGTLHLIIRDQGKTKRLYHSLSFDQGETWTVPVKTNYPDAVSKNFAGRLPHGGFYLINNLRTSGLRDPLAISFSQDGWTFSRPKALRRDSPERRFEGKAKPKHSFQYADAMEHDGKLWVIYATNKEDIEVSAYNLEDLPK